MEHVVVACRRCEERLTDRLAWLPSTRVPTLVSDEVGFEPTVAEGFIAVDPRPVAVQQDGTPPGSLGCLVINPDDARMLDEHPDPMRNSGCCGHDGLDGPNQRCPTCRAEVATLRDDCWSRVKLRFEAECVSLTGL